MCWFNKKINVWFKWKIRCEWNRWNKSILKVNLKAHPFFHGVDWRNIRNKPAFNIPEISSEIDVSNFDKFDEEEPWIVNAPKNRKQDINFIGYTFKRDIENERSSVVSALEKLEHTKAKTQMVLPASRSFKNI